MSVPSARPRRSAAAAALAGATILLAGCGSPAAPAAAPSAAAAFPMTYDNCGTPVTIDAPPQRAMSLAADNSTAVAAIGAVDKLAARAAEGGAPLKEYAAALEPVPQISEGGEPTKEVIVGQQVDVLLSYDNLRTPPADLEALGVHVLYPSWRCDTEPVGFDDVFDTLTRWGTLFGTEPAATAAVGELRGRVEKATATAAGLPTLTAAAIWVGDASMYAYGTRSVSQTVLDAANLTNVFADTPDRIFEVNLETLLARNPDVVILQYGGTQTTIKTDDDAVRAFEALPSAGTLTAVQQRRLVPINFTQLVGGPIAVDGLETVVAARTSFR
jgi:iron complex transport system substrate-binding protein